MFNKIFSAISSKNENANIRKPHSTCFQQADAWIEKGRKFEDKGQLDEAYEHYKNAVAAAPKYAPAHLNLGIILTALGDIKEAKECYQ
jgi:tetratricopeptide (TPR) repeat protein